MQLGTAQGQTLYTVDAFNLHYLTRITASKAIKTDIRNAINACLVATIHETPVSFGSRVSRGYSLIHTQSGAEAYRIGSGHNGSECRSESGTDPSGQEECADKELTFDIIIATLDEAGSKGAKRFNRIKDKLDQAKAMLDIIKKCSAYELVFGAIPFAAWMAALTKLLQEAIKKAIPPPVIATIASVLLGAFTLTITIEFFATGCDG